MDPSGGYAEYPFVAEFYDSVIPYRDRNDVNFFVEMARDSQGPVLEVGCGTGRVLIPTARSGIEILGLDFSESMLAVCREKLSHEPEPIRSRVELVQGDMRRFDLGRQFKLATIPFRPFQHLMTVEDQLACLSCIRGHLIDGGRLVLDVFNPSLPHLVDDEYLVEYGDEPEFLMADGRRVWRRMRTVSRDLINQVQDVELIYHVTHHDGHKERLVHSFQMRYLYRYEAEHLLVRSGFQIEELYADYDRSPYGSKSPGELIVVARNV